MNRRSFFGMLASGAATLGVKPAFAAAAARLGKSVTPMSDAPAKISMARYTSDAFRPLVGQVFAFHRTADTKDAPVHLELVEVQSSKHQGMAGSCQPFSLLFALRSSDATQESTLHLRHDQFEPSAWFVNRVVAPGRDSKNAYYEAVFG